MINTSYNKKGYTLILSVIVASIVLSIAAFILSVSRKQFILSSVARDSTLAIYAADSGIQCAVEAYKNEDGNNLATGTPSAPRNASINCAETGVPVPNPAPNASSEFGEFDTSPPFNDPPMNFITSYVAPDNQTYYFNIYQTSPMQVNLPNNTCARIIVTDGYYLTSANVLQHKTVIDSSGYNVSNSGPCSDPANPANPRAVERTIRLEYKD